MFKRNIKTLLEKALARSPVVLLSGARQVGKTTLALELLKEKNYTYLTFDDEITYLTAKGNMTGFITNIQKPVILDEVQRIPELFLAIKMDVDSNRAPGRYLLTGSANPLLIPRLGDSLVGRMEIIDLMPLSQGEIIGVKDLFIDRIFSGDFLQSPGLLLSKEELYKKVLVGGYPLVQFSNEEDHNAWIHSYLSLLLQKDVKDLIHAEKLTEFPYLLKILASRISGLFNVANLARESKIPAKTLARYLAVLEAIFLINLQPSWHTNLTLRSIKSPKMYFVDTGLLSYLLDINLQRALKDSVHMGQMVENFVVSEFKKQITWNATKVQSYHFRTPAGEEVDIVLENRSGDIVGVEIKSSEMVTMRDFKGLNYLKEKAGKKFIKGVVLYTGSKCVPFGDDIYAVPISWLWAA